MSYLKFDTSVSLYVTRERDPEDKWDNDITDGTVEILGCSLVDDDGYRVLQTDFDVQPGDKIWLVWAQYSTGDSFGSYGGQYELCKACKDALTAKKEVERLNSMTDYSVPWNGYFERLDFIRAEEFEVNR